MIHRSLRLSEKAVASEIQPVASQEKEHPRHPNPLGEARYRPLSEIEESNVLLQLAFNPGVKKALRDHISKETQAMAEIKRALRHPNPVAEERYQLVVWLVRIGRRHRIGIFQQPEFVSKIFGRYMPDPKLGRTDADMRGERSSERMVC